MGKAIEKQSKEDIIIQLISSPKDRVAIFKGVPQNNQGFILLGLSKRLQEELIEELSDKELIGIINFLDPDEATDLLQNAPAVRRKRLLRKLSADIKEKVEFLLKFNPKTAAGMMSLDYIEVTKSITFEDLSDLIRKHEIKTGKFPTILVVENGFLIGEVAGHTLVLHKGKERIGPFVKKIPSIRFDSDQSKVIATFKNHPHNKIVVLDQDRRILGIIYSDDILHVIEEKPAKGLYGFAGVDREEDVYDSVASKVKYRYRWLILNLATAFLAASVVSIFQNTIETFVLLAVYMPIIAGMGGNTGTQTLAVLVRGIALKEIELRNGGKVILKEVLAGTLNGVIIGCIVTVIAGLLHRDPLFGVIVGVSMIINMMIAGLFGALVPLIMKALGKDPATSAAIFMTTATDLFSFFVFLGLAQLIL